MSLVSENNPLLVTLTVNELTTIIEEAVDKKVKQLLPKPEPKFYSATELASKFGVTRQTINRYEKTGLIKGKRWGHIKRYEEIDVEAALITIQRYKRA